MADVIDLTGRKKLKDDLERAEKLDSLRGALRCGACAMKCAKCGAHGDPTTVITHRGSGATFCLCPTCHEEYTDLLSYLDDGMSSDFPAWYNREWVRQWLAWLDYQWAMANYMDSPEVLAVVAKLREE